MKRLMVGVVVSALLVGCVGLDILTLHPEQVEQSRKSADKALDGYVLYEPVVVVEVSLKDVCVAGKDEKGNCKAATVVQCSASTPFLLPDYSKPYLVRSKNGFGKTGVDVAILDGWRLGSIKDNSDNTAVLGTIEKLFGIKSVASNADGATCKAPGLYQVTLENGVPALRPLKLY
ncbi:hypothetical protein MTYP_01408 [Methylophilaceae bacterium]|nr:hypothetical protein MTYP_01408 [Methylophilaceae bacterium]